MVVLPRIVLISPCLIGTDETLQRMLLLGGSPIHCLDWLFNFCAMYDSVLAEELAYLLSSEVVVADAACFE